MMGSDSFVQLVVAGSRMVIVLFASSTIPFEVPTEKAVISGAAITRELNRSMKYGATTCRMNFSCSTPRAVIVLGVVYGSSH